MALRLYNTLTQSVETFAPLRDNTVRMYTCGPTVYDFAHIGNFRPVVVFDPAGGIYSRINGFAPDRFEQTLVQRIEEARLFKGR